MATCQRATTPACEASALLKHILCTEHAVQSKAPPLGCHARAMEAWRHQAGWRAARRAAPGGLVPGARTARWAPRRGPSRGRPPGLEPPAPAFVLVCASSYSCCKDMGPHSHRLHSTVCQSRVLCLVSREPSEHDASWHAGFTHLRDVVCLQCKKVMHQQSPRTLPCGAWSLC